MHRRRHDEHDGASAISGILFIGTALRLLTSSTAGILILLLFTGMMLAKMALDDRIA